jgi:hypothetical protein
MTQNDLFAARDAILDNRGSRRRYRFYKVRLSEREAWTGSAIAALFNALGMLLEIVIVRKVPGISPTPALISAAIGFTLLALLLIGRKKPSRLWASVAFSVNTASVVTALQVTNRQFALLESNWVPFQASKLGCLIAALLAPGFGIGLLSILAYTFSALFQFEFFFPPELKAQVDQIEPWPILAFGLAGIFALIYRFRQAQLEQELAEIQAQHFAIRELTNAFLNIRDLMNTPLQVMEFSLQVLRNSNDVSQRLLDRLDRSVQSLKQVNVMLVQHEKEIQRQAYRKTETVG